MVAKSEESITPTSAEVRECLLTSSAVAVILAVKRTKFGGDGWESNPPRTPQQRPADGFEDRGEHQLPNIPGAELDYPSAWTDTRSANGPRVHRDRRRRRRADRTPLRRALDQSEADRREPWPRRPRDRGARRPHGRAHPLDPAADARPAKQRGRHRDHRHRDRGLGGR